MTAQRDDMKLHEYLSELQADATILNLHDAPDSDDDASYDGNSGAPGTASAARRGAKRERELVGDDDTESLASGRGALSGGAESARREHHNKHTRKCRARLKSKFDAVLDMLPPPSGAREVKHKVQVLEYAMHEFRSLDSELRGLEWALALNSHRHLLQWVSSFARTNTDLSSALEPFIDLFCAKKGFVYAETWRPTAAAPLDMFIERYVVRDSTWCAAGLRDRLARTGDRFTRAQHVIPASDPLLQHALSRLRPQVAHPGAASDNPASPDQVHARLLAEAGVATTLLVPVPVCGEVARLVAFHDTRERSIDAETQRLAAVIATSIGNAFNAAEHERSLQSNRTARP